MSINSFTITGIFIWILISCFFKNYDLKALIPFVVQFSNVPFSPQKNMANDRHRNIQNAIFGFKKNDKILKKIILQIPSQSLKEWASIGPNLFTKYFRNTHYVKHDLLFNNSAVHYYQSSLLTKNSIRQNIYKLISKACPFHSKDLLFYVKNYGSMNFNYDKK